MDGFLKLNCICIDFWKLTCQDCLPESHGTQCNIITLPKQIPPKLCLASVPSYFCHISYFFQVKQDNNKIKEITKICWKGIYILFFRYKIRKYFLILVKKLLQSSSDGHITWREELCQQCSREGLLNSAGLNMGQMTGLEWRLQRMMQSKIKARIYVSDNKYFRKMTVI